MGKFDDGGVLSSSHELKLGRWGLGCKEGAYVLVIHHNGDVPECSFW